MRKPVIGLALGSGGARGWCHIGVLRELTDMGLQPQVVAGSSMGALVGAAYAAGKLDALEEWARSLTLRTMMTVIDMRIGGGGLVSGQGITSMLQDLGMPEQIQDLALPFIAVATDLRTGREIWLRTGNTVDSVRASVSIPGLLRPKWLDDRWLIDGGTVNPVPVSAARALGAEAVIAVNPNAAYSGAYWDPADTKLGLPDFTAMLPDRLKTLWGSDAPKDDISDHTEPSYVALITATIDIMSDQIRRSRLAGDPPQIMLDAHLGTITMVDFHHADTCIAEGRRIVREQADGIAAQLKA